jgi:hypothetical protein
LSFIVRAKVARQSLIREGGIAGAVNQAFKQT